jgi:hypothetical protein
MWIGNRRVLNPKSEIRNPQSLLRSRAKRPWILKSAGVSVVLGRTKVYVIPLLFDRSLGRTLLCVSAPEQRDRADQQQNRTGSHQFRGRSESDSHRPHSSEAQPEEQATIWGISGRMTNMLSAVWPTIGRSAIGYSRWSDRSRPLIN